MVGELARVLAAKLTEDVKSGSLKDSDISILLTLLKYEQSNVGADFEGRLKACEEGLKLLGFKRFKVGGTG